MTGPDIAGPGIAVPAARRLGAMRAGDVNATTPSPDDGQAAHIR